MKMNIMPRRCLSKKEKKVLIEGMSHIRWSVHKGSSLAKKLRHMPVNRLFWTAVIAVFLGLEKL